MSIVRFQDLDLLTSSGLWRYQVSKSLPRTSRNLSTKLFADVELYYGTKRLRASKPGVANLR